jgi:hypothetical protein
LYYYSAGALQETESIEGAPAYLRLPKGFAHASSLPHGRRSLTPAPFSGMNCTPAALPALTVRLMLFAASAQ